MATFVAALLALLAAWLTHFVAEDYRTFKKGSSVAAMLSGEIQSYQEAFMFSDDLYEQLATGVADGKVPHLPKIRLSNDLALDVVLPDIGLLGPAACRDICYVYQNLRAFRNCFEAACTDRREMGDVMTAELLLAAFAAQKRAATRYSSLIAALNARSNARWTSPLQSVLQRWNITKNRSS